MSIRESSFSLNIAQISDNADWVVPSIKPPRVFSEMESTLIKHAQEHYGEYYAYEDTDFGAALQSGTVTVTCPEHGKIEVNSDRFFNGVEGCVTCAIKTKRKTDVNVVWDATNPTYRVAVIEEALLNDEGWEADAPTAIDFSDEQIVLRQLGDSEAVYFPLRNLYIFGIFSHEGFKVHEADLYRYLDDEHHNVVIFDEKESYQTWLDTDATCGKLAKIVAKFPRIKAPVTIYQHHSNLTAMKDHIASFKYDRFAIYGIYRGGLMYSIPLSYAFEHVDVQHGIIKYQRYDRMDENLAQGVKLIESHQSKYDEYDDTPIFVVDDLLSSGITMEESVKFLNNLWPNAQIHPLVAYGNSDTIPDVRTHPGKWLSFPYEEV